MDIRNIDDKYFKEAIENPELAASLMKIILPKEIKEIIDLEPTLRMSLITKLKFEQKTRDIQLFQEDPEQFASNLAFDVQRRLSSREKPSLHGHQNSTSCKRSFSYYV